MLFRRREMPSYWDRFKLWLWPRVSWRRSGLYFLKRILRLSGTPYAIAIGAALGAGVAFTPFLGFHLLITAGIAWLVRGNVIAGAIASCVGNPITFPFIWAGSYRVGKLMLGESGTNVPLRLEHDLFEKSWVQLWPIIKPMLIGSVPLGLAAGCIVYFLVYKTVTAYREGRRERVASRRQVSSPAE